MEVNVIIHVLLVEAQKLRLRKERKYDYKQVDRLLLVSDVDFHRSGGQLSVVCGLNIAGHLFFVNTVTLAQLSGYPRGVRPCKT